MWEFNTTIEDFKNTSGVWGGHLVVDDVIVQEIKQQSFKRLICTLNEVESFHCALMPMGNGIYFINVNKDIRKKLHLTFGSLLKVKLVEDTSKYGMPMPEEMAEILAQDEEANSIFHQLTPGKQRSLLYQIGLPKTSESRIKKAVLITRYLISVSGKLDFREMNDFIKNNKL